VTAEAPEATAQGQRDWTAIRAVTFDTGGTLLDWHTGIRDALEPLAQKYDWDLTADVLANEWRTKALTELKRPGAGPRPNADWVHANTFDALLNDHNYRRPDPVERAAAVAAWHTLEPWVDVRPGLKRLRPRFILAPLTILSTSIVIDVSRYAELQWDALISCEMMGVYKPAPDVYRTAARWLGLEPREILMVACHNRDLLAAQEVGFRTAFIRRPWEWGGPSHTSADGQPDTRIDTTVDSLESLVDELATHHRQMTAPKQRT